MLQYLQRYGEGAMDDAQLVEFRFKPKVERIGRLEHCASVVRRQIEAIYVGCALCGHACCQEIL